MAAIVHASFPCMSLTFSTMMRLRGKTQIDMIDAPLELGFFLDRMHLDGKIRAAELTHPAPDAVIWPSRESLSVS
jgi:hypothetical protein